MDGTNSTDGTRLTGIDHLRQSIKDILTTPVGSRVMRREYGSRLFELIDAPMNSKTIMKIYAETVAALKRWEPRFAVSKVSLATSEPGSFLIDLTGEYLPDGTQVKLDGVVVQ